ncbi:hypothetical protein NLI96_g6885 [Meripilus lineatus]|uniref:F-box domain-containing protein n=1 Tax=Meripilus lineatus TaxID=2056292 RepID=A0AAD5V0E9_9APHY|nr:hypothetical protein NLI96_g6885 [Physisporinus lineatus]
MVLGNETPSVTFDHLPAELLVEIIHWLRVETKVTPPWYHTTFVCRRWRTIILGYSPFWARINTNNLEQTKTCLERSKSAPIHITVASLPPEDDRRRALTSLLSPHLHRTKLLWVNVQHAEDLIRYLGPSFPILRNLCILPGLDDIPDEIHVSLDAPRIRCLHVSQATLNWESTLYKDLESLWLLSAFEVPPTIHKFLDVLEACPSLSVLNLMDFMLDTPDTPLTQENRSIRLPLFRECHIGGARSDVATLLRHINISSCDAFSLEFKPSGRARKCSSLWVLPQDTNSRFPFIRHFTNAKLEVELPLTATSADSDILDHKCDVQVGLSFDQGDDSTFSVSFPSVNVRLRPVIFDSVFAFLQPFSITTLEVAYDLKYIDQNTWETALWNLPRLKCLTVTAITYDATQSFRPAQLYAALSSTNTREQVVCPKLEQLYLFRVMLHPTFVDLLYSTLQIRALLGSRVHSFTIEDWYPIDEVRHVWPDFSEVVDEFMVSERSSEIF